MRLRSSSARLSRPFTAANAGLEQGSAVGRVDVGQPASDRSGAKKARLYGAGGGVEPTLAEGNGILSPFPPSGAVPVTSRTYWYH